MQQFMSEVITDTAKISVKLFQIFVIQIVR